MLWSWAVAAQAGDVVNIGAQECSSGEPTTTVTDTVLEMACSGAFTLTNVEIVTDKKVVIHGGESLELKGDFAKFTAPVTELSTEGPFTLDAPLSPSGDLVINEAAPLGPEGLATKELDQWVTGPSSAIGSAGTLLVRRAAQNGSVLLQPSALMTINQGPAIISYAGPTRQTGPISLGSVGAVYGGSLTIVPVALPTSAPIVATSASSPPASGGGGGLGWLELGALGLLSWAALAEDRAPIH